ncbi:high frequency lysogenization protein HflD [Pseudomonas sp. HK3]|jgi:high frequency lysogenization protein
MSKVSIDNQALALAGIFQAAHLVEQIARTGNINEKDLKTCIESLFQTHPRSIEDVYGGSRENLKLGYKEVRFLTDGKTRTGSSPDVMRYALGVLHLESKLRKNNKIMPKVSAGIEQAKRQLDHFHSSHENLIANLSGLYQETLSTFRFRIHVTGNAQHLQNAQNAHKIRALLLCAVRSAILWRQVGGRRWQLLFNRQKLNKSCQETLEKI